MGTSTDLLEECLPSHFGTRDRTDRGDGRLALFRRLNFIGKYRLTGERYYLTRY